MNREAVRAALRAAAARAAEAGLAAVEPRACVRRALEAQPLDGPCRVLALGKAARAMVEGALDALGPALRGGLAVLPFAEGLPASIGPVTLVQGAHPLPDASSAAAGALLLDAAAALGDDETALVLLSGGASSLAAVPIEGATIEELAAISSELLRSGAAISEINALRSTLSRLHGGGLSSAIGGRPARTLAISDVPFDVPRDIGGGPMHEDAPAGERRFEIVASGRHCAAAAAAALRREGFLVELDESLMSADAAEAATAALLRFRGSGSGARALIAWGESGVRVRSAGRGGRCTHAALSAALALERGRRRGGLAAEIGAAGVGSAGAEPELVFLACASDGEDGASLSAGALVDRESASRARAKGRSPKDDLAAFESALSLEASGDLRARSATLTNVADLWFALRDDGPERLVPLEEAGGLRLPRLASATGTALLVRAELRRALLGAATEGDLALLVERAWDEGEALLAGGDCVVLATAGEDLALALRERGLEPDAAEPRRWRLPGGRAGRARPSWA